MCNITSHVFRLYGVNENAPHITSTESTNQLIKRRLRWPHVLLSTSQLHQGLYKSHLRPFENLSERFACSLCVCSPNASVVSAMAETCPRGRKKEGLIRNISFTYCISSIDLRQAIATVYKLHTQALVVSFLHTPLRCRQSKNNDVEMYGDCLRFKNKLTMIACSAGSEFQSVHIHALSTPWLRLGVLEIYESEY
jgi:hypothetical protein